MSVTVEVRTYGGFPFNDREILRYAGVKTPDERTLSLLEEVKAEAAELLVYKVCYARIPVSFEGGRCAFNGFYADSLDLAKALKDCEETLLFCATAGVGLDRLLIRYERVAPSKAVLLQALGAERVETFCDSFCKEFEREKGVRLKPRFSPGYGDLSLETQRAVFSVLAPEKKIGVTLGTSLLMSPSKSVTAFAGIIEKEATVYEVNTENCEKCNRKDGCALRREV